VAKLHLANVSVRFASKAS